MLPFACWQAMATFLVLPAGEYMLLGDGGHHSPVTTSQRIASVLGGGITTHFSLFVHCQSCHFLVIVTLIALYFLQPFSVKNFFHFFFIH